jgi:glycosyltransferase involved in cell wall biosynthesis
MVSKPKVSAPSISWVALLGRRDEPTDGVEDYCSFLGDALGRRGVELKQFRLRWHEDGWFSALRRFSSESRKWRGKWVLLQYTALAWSRRGFPVGVLAVQSILHRRGARVAVVFHEPFGLGGPRWIDRLRGTIQDWVVRYLYKSAVKAIMLDPLEKIPWLPNDGSKAAFISIGANVPEPMERPKSTTGRNERKIIAVFCVDHPPFRERELGEISHAVRFGVKKGLNLRIVFIGKGTAEASQDIDRAFEGIPLEVLNLGLRSAAEVSRTLAESDVMLCVRGKVYPRRGSAIAGIACGVPIVGYAGAAEGTPLAEAGVQLVPFGDRQALGVALERVLSDTNLRKELHERSLTAQRKYFSWDVIANVFMEALDAKAASK